MRMMGSIHSKNKEDGVVRSLRLGLRVYGLAMATSAFVTFKNGQTGEGLVSLGFALVYLLLASTDLRKMWDSRHMNAMCAARANPPSVRFAIGAGTAYICIISGVTLQCFA